MAQLLLNCGSSLLADVFVTVTAFMFVPVTVLTVKDLKAYR